MVRHAQLGNGEQLVSGGLEERAPMVSQAQLLELGQQRRLPKRRIQRTKKYFEIKPKCTQFSISVSLGDRRTDISIDLYFLIYSNIPI